MVEHTYSKNGWSDRSSPVAIASSPVIPPQPYVPLRKASPQRLQSRRAGPHPLLYTGQHGSRPFRPGTSPSSASPDYSHAIAMGTQFTAERTDSYDQHARKNSLDTVVPASTNDSTSDSWPLWNDSGMESPGKRRAARVRQSRSISEGMRGLRERLAWQHEHGTSGGILEPESSWEDLPTPQEVMPDGARTSFPSVITTNSSYMGSFTSAKRSSQATGYSSNSDLVKIHSSSPVMMQDENFSVEDAIGMYADGFETPSKGSLDIIRDRSPDRRGSSPYQSPKKRPVNLHRRSRSVGPSESFPMYLKGQDKLSTQPVSPRKSRAETPEVRDVTSPKKRVESTQSQGSEPILQSPKSPKQSRGPANSGKPVPRDRYGFKKASHHFSLEEHDAWERTYNEHIERRRAKWETLMKQYGLSTHQPTRFPPRSDKIKRYIRKGIPPEWRGAAWFWYAGGPGLQKQHEGLYWALLLDIKRGDGLKETDREHIERDLNRTFPDNLTFKPDPPPSATGEIDDDNGPETPIIGALRRVLQAFAVHRPSIGYCQSLNFIAGLLLLFLDQDEEKAFLLLNVITTDYLPGTHGVSLEGANIDIAVLMASLKDQLPSVWAKIDDQQQPADSSTTPTSPSTPAPLPTVSLATTPWFLTLFLTTLPIESALRVWDVLFLEGSKTLFRAGLAIFKLAEPRIRAVADPIEVFQIVQSAPRGMLDANALMDLCFRRRGGGFGGLSQDTIERRREDGRRQRRRAGLGVLMRAPTDLGEQSHRVEETGGFKGRLRSMTKAGKA